MPADSLPDRDLARLLDEQIDAMQAVLSSLEAERQALSARDAEALLKAVSSKADSLTAADAVDQRRQALLERFGMSDRAGRTGRLGHPSRSFSKDGGIAQRWRQVLALTQQCRALNDTNGHLIRGQRRHVDGALRLLRGEPVASTEYGPGGITRQRSGQRSLATF